jgi:hypothetical protein
MPLKEWTLRRLSCLEGEVLSPRLHALMNGLLAGNSGPGA